MHSAALTKTSIVPYVSSMQNSRSTLPNNTQARKPSPTRPRAKARSSLNSGLDVLECLVENRRPMTLTEIATALGISKSNVHQLLATLTRRRLIERLRDQTYRIGIKAWEIGSRAQPLEIGRIGAPHLVQLVRDVSEGADIGMLDGVNTVCIALVECPQPVRVHARVGDRNLAHSTSTGLVLLAELSDEELMALLPETLDKVAPDTFSNRDALLKELRRIRMRGYAIYRGGWRSDVTGVAVPIRSPDGRAVAGLCVPAPSYRVTRKWLDKIVPTLKNTAERIEHDLAGGYDVSPAPPLGLRSGAGG
jgi:DNA-binding IclR family transcriptional regulator